MLETFITTLDRLKFTRRLGYFTTLGITIYATMWSLGFPVEAIKLGYSASEVAMIIGAVMAPISMLQGFVINAYYSKGTNNALHNASYQDYRTTSYSDPDDGRFVRTRREADRGGVREATSRVPPETGRSDHRIRSRYS